MNSIKHLNQQLLVNIVIENFIMYESNGIKKWTYKIV
nr:MAG TPA: hypothetical protein [Caudoviricetes sp.]